MTNPIISHFNHMCSGFLEHVLRFGALSLQLENEGTKQDHFLGPSA